MNNETLYQQTFENLQPNLIEKMDQIAQAIATHYPLFEITKPAVAGLENRKVFVDLSINGEFALGLDLVLVNGDYCIAQNILENLSKSLSPTSKGLLKPAGYSVRLDIQGYANEYLGCFSPSNNEEPLFTPGREVLKNRISSLNAEELIDFLRHRVITRERFSAEVVNSRCKDRQREHAFG